MDDSGIWELFEAANPEQKVALFQSTLDAGVLDDDYAFEFLNLIRKDFNAESQEDRTAYTQLLDRFREQEPEIFRQSSHYYHRDLLNYAIVEGRWSDIPELLEPFTQEHVLDDLLIVAAQLKYHGQVRPLIEAMQIARPKIRGSDRYIPGADDEFDAVLMELILVDYLENSTAPRPDDPALLEPTADLLRWKKGWLDWFILAVSEPGAWSLEDLWEKSGKKKRTRHFDTLFVGFIAAQRRAGVPLTRGLMAWRKWAEVFHGPFVKFKRPQKSKKSRASPPSALLIPRIASVRKMLDESFGFLGGDPYEVIAAMGLIQPYLEYLEDLGLIGTDEVRKTGEKIKPLVDQLDPLMGYFNVDPAARANLTGAWSAW
jgi:hypothetical protein